MKNDLIKRQAAIDAVMDEFKKIPTNAIRAKTRLEELPPAQPKVSMLTVTVAPSPEDIERTVRKIHDAPVTVLPPAQPERKRGEWIDHEEDGYVECPCCGSATNCDGNRKELHYCFSCGARLE